MTYPRDHFERVLAKDLPRRCWSVVEAWNAYQQYEVGYTEVFPNNRSRDMVIATVTTTAGTIRSVNRGTVTLSPVEIARQWADEQGQWYTQTIISADLTVTPPKATVECAFSPEFPVLVLKSEYAPPFPTDEE
jgi:hypothetical protein